MEEIKDLIEKIQHEGVKVAEEKAQRIEEEARQVAADVIQKAKQEADKIILGAKESCAQMDSAMQASLKQAGRDLIISLKKEINSVLEKIITKEIRHALNPDDLAKIIAATVKGQMQKEGQKSEVSLSQEDYNKLEGIFSKLKDELKHGLVLKPSQEVLGGFVISFDAGKSYFDFSDHALADYIGSYLKPQLAEILK